MDCSNRTAGAHAPKLNCHPFVAASKPEQTCQRAVIPTDQSYLGGAVVIVAAACGNPLPCADHPVVQPAASPFTTAESRCFVCKEYDKNNLVVCDECLKTAMDVESITAAPLQPPDCGESHRKGTPCPAPAQPSEDENERKAFQRVWDRIRDREFGNGSVVASMAGIVREIWAERGAWERSKRR